MLAACTKTEAPSSPLPPTEAIPSSPAPDNLSEPIIDGSGAMSCPAGLVLVTDTTPVRCEYDNRPL